MTLTSKQRLKKQADDLWKFIILRDHPTCEACNEKQSHDPHHFFSKGLYGILRLELENGVGLCISCHFSRHHQGDPLIHEKVIKIRGTAWYNKLKKLSKSNKSSYQTPQYYRDKIDEFKKLL